ncbi:MULTISPECIES: glutamate-5-semialdehyde dehydrogenase [Clostridium]|uniref:Gamma-glutamyl phosphate reductase n=1 Tax=Clostridium novyi (strain NT) TaxID=386415 RepID=PROA_CLONN|nr:MULTISPECIES: glutamate-5-semialdehyde dehydrogenase [Clostridium]A0PXA4.1 RecName: Full=Gamma-glutamyl phosphate reductase; Short=GPR; AltName: Full=Glutamate-5-semialdehyde dehydrogenase; AltName: Full=Glutamyl-gamma-semialdehyde dehydrogenase; Short=GSA dehydrogenase [Clostridium novyi NT]ABK60892.1 gamma-glutamyl phosphate reductase [Clostridium novyi NT]KEH86893.1 gamma-glutamyl phosphate reductase [Clostridium novyi A str. NCTC 538]KEH89787.1 gamma-glutamyl phosphate reductase [Clostri
MNIENYVIETASLAKSAARKMSIVSTVTKNNALNAMADALIENTNAIIEANKKDMENGREKGLTESLLDRLLLDEARIKSMAQGLRDVASLEDPIGEVIRMWRRPNNLKIGQIRVPLGVIGIIYEARPNVTVDAAALCVKSGNAVILRGGSEAINSNTTVARIISEAATKAGLPEGAINLIENPSRDAVNVMMKLNDYIDVLIPRGGAGLINAVVKNATVPVIQTGVGNCHVFVDASADLEMAANIVINAKTQRPAVCNAMESLLVHKDIADKFLPYLAEKLKPLNVEIKGCIRTQSLVEGATEATEEDWAKEYLDFKFASKVVDSLDEALDHIYKYSTKHSEVIVTNNYENSQRFLAEVDAAAVYVNASSRFTDGSEFGFGAEIGISTQKLHARGPMGLKELTSSKYIIYGEGQIR